MDPQPLEGFKVRAACPQPWEGMSGDDRSRTCAACDHEVVNLSAMSRAEGLELITGRQARGEKVCVYYLEWASGRIVTEEGPKLLRRPKRRLLRLAAAASATFGLGLVTAGCPGPAPYPGKQTKTKKTKTEATKTEGTKAEATKTEATKTEATKTEATKTKAPEPEAPEPEAGKTG